ncbi:imelysin family protein, partial [Rhizobium ruizarguesonis]
IVGAIAVKHVFEHILFYPDRKGVGLKQVQALITKADPNDSTVDAIAGKSVALQGLTALEYVLYVNGSDDLVGQKGSGKCL